LGTVQSTLSVGGCGREIFYNIFFGHLLVAVRQGQLPQQEKNDSAGVQRGRVNISGFIGTVERFPSRRCTSDEFGFVAGAPTLTHVCTAGACGTKPRRGPPAAMPGEGVWRMLEAMARIAPRIRMVPNKISLKPSCFLWTLFDFFLEDSNRRIGLLKR
jgi:hypothetical protein